MKAEHHINCEAYMKRIEAVHEQYARRKHPLWQAILGGKLSRAQIIEWIKQSSIVPLYNHHYHGYLYINCPNPTWRTRMAEVVYEEGTGRLYADGVAHYELFLRLGEALGLSRKEMYATEYCAGALAVRHYFENVCRRSFLEGFAALGLGIEATIVGVGGKTSDILKKHYGITEEQAAFYRVHEVADSDHSSGGLEFLTEFARTEADAERVVSTIRDALEVFQSMFTDIWGRVNKIQPVAL